MGLLLVYRISYARLTPLLLEILAIIGVILFFRGELAKAKKNKQ
jgi:hypothetical protein